MPLKLNIAMSRKIGEPNYGSRGATVGLEMEVDSGLVDQPRELHVRIARLFRLANASVDRELNRRVEATLSHTNGCAVRGTAATRRATSNQIRALHAIASERQIDLLVELRRRFQVERLEELTLGQASELIGAIKEAGDAVIPE
jgi:hypothetical protein